MTKKKFLDQLNLLMKKKINKKLLIFFGIYDTPKNISFYHLIREYRRKKGLACLKITPMEMQISMK
jgi:hypothetical protein